MKKTLLALAVPALLAAGSASAADVYNQDGVIVTVGGAAEIQFIDDYTKDKDADIKLDDGELNFTTLVDVNDQLQAIGFFDFEVENGAEESGVVSDELWAGFVTKEAGTISFGRLYLIADDAGIGEDYELGGESFGFAETKSDRGIKYTYDNGQFYAGLSHSLDANDAPGAITDGRIGARFEGVDVRAYLYDSDYNDVDTFGYNLEAVYAQDNWSVAGSFGNFEDENAAGETTADIDAFSVSATYTMNATTFAGGFNYLDDSENDADVSTLYVNVTQQLHSNVKVYAEVGFLDGEAAGVDLDKLPADNKYAREDFGYVVGMEVSF